MTKELILAGDMNEALKKAKTLYGPEAYILDKRTIRERIPGTMRVRSRVELTVGMSAPGERPGSELRYGASPDLSVSEGASLEIELKRLDSIVGEMEEQAARLESREESAYPLESILRDWGLFESTIQRLRRDFEQEVPLVDRANSEAAVSRIRESLRLVGKMKLEELRGLHALTGPPGSGKTSLAIKLADRVASTGAGVVILCFDPRHCGEAARLEEAAGRYGFEVALAGDPVTMLGALRHLLDRDLVLLDMPPLEERHWDMLERVERSLHREPLFRHLVVAADGGWRGLEPAAGVSDFLAVTRADLDSAIRPALDLLVHGDFNLGFISAGREPGSPLTLAEEETLLEPLKRRITLSKGASRGVTA